MKEELNSPLNNVETAASDDPQSVDELQALQQIFNILNPFDERAVKKILRTVSTFYELGTAYQFSQSKLQELKSTKNTTRFSDNRDLSPKDFMMEKKPQTDVEKIACLAYYLTHYKDQEEFKTIDLSKLNTEAAQIKFSNATVAVDHATRHSHFLVPTKKGLKKLSAIGELYVQALPDRDEAKQVLTKNKPRRRNKRNKKSSINKDN